MRRGILAVVALALALAAGCASSPPQATPADITVCHQFYVYDNSIGTAGNPLGTLEAQWQSDPAPSAAVDADLTTYLTLMEAGGFAPGSGEQEQTAQAAVNVINDCTALKAYH